MRRALLEALAVAFAVVLIVGLLIQPRVIGWQCEGKALPQLAAEESDLPPCETIEPLF